jgi:nucleoid-associated protein YgaU
MVPVPPAHTTYLVKQGDTLEKIAVQVYGDARQWRRIYQANRDGLKSPNRIYAGQKLIIPPPEGESEQQISGASDLK